jgi:hypothetical protein
LGRRRFNPGLPSHAGSKAGGGYCPTSHAPPHARKFPANRDGSEAKAIAPRSLLSCRSNIKAAGLRRKHGGSSAASVHCSLPFLLSVVSWPTTMTPYRMQCTAESRPPPKQAHPKVGVADYRDFHRCFQDSKHSERLCFVFAVCGFIRRPDTLVCALWGGPNAGRPGAGVWATPVEKLMPSSVPLEFSLSLGT